MMELDELRQVLNAKTAPSFPEKSSAQFETMLHQKRSAITQKIKNNLLIELFISIVFATLCIYMIFFSGYRIYNILFTVAFIVCLSFITVLLVLIRKANIITNHHSIKQNLQQLIRLIDEFIKRYLQLTIILTPITFIFSVWLSYNNEETVLMPLGYKMILFLFMLLLASTGMVYFFTKWYLAKQYGNYLHQLKTMLEEFDE